MRAVADVRYFRGPVGALAQGSGLPVLIKKDAVSGTQNCLIDLGTEQHNFR